MKLLNVFGLVVGAHLAVLTVIFATPGCRSTGKQKPKPEDTLAANAGSGVTPVDSIAPTPAAMSNADLNPAAPAAVEAPTSVSSVAPVSPAPAASAEVGVRFAPTRPAAAPEAAPAPAAANATHAVAKGDSLWSIARKYGITVDELAAANQLAKSATLRLGQQIVVPAKAAPPAPETDAANTYEVKSGDTLGGIARRHGTTVGALRAASNLSGDGLRVGQKLVIPGNAVPLSASAVATPVAAAPRAGSGSYTVVPGDTLGSIAKKHGVKVGDLATLNTITDPAKLRVGQVLKLPSGAKAPAAPRPVATAPASVPAIVEEAAPAPITPVAPPATVEPMAVPVIRID